MKGSACGYNILRLENGKYSLTLDSVPELNDPEQRKTLGPFNEVKSFLCGDIFAAHTYGTKINNKIFIGLIVINGSGYAKAVEGLNWRNKSDLIKAKFNDSGEEGYMGVELYNTTQMMTEEKGLIDLLGNFSEYTTEKGDDVFSYYQEKMSAEELIAKHFSDKKLMPFILNEEKNRCIRDVLNTNGDDIGEEFINECAKRLASLEALYSAKIEESNNIFTKKSQIAKEILEWN